MVWATRAALLAVAFLGIGSVVYLLYKKDNSEEDEEDYESFSTARGKVIELKVPKESYGLIIGRAGSTIKDIEAQSDCRIHFKDGKDSDTHRVCVIRGSPDSVQVAEFLIHEVIANQPLIENYEMCVPAQAVRRIIGKNGENILSISRNSNAKIIVLSAEASGNASERKIVIKGTAEQIAFAKLLVEQKVEEENEFRNRIESSLASRSPRHKAKYLMSGSGETENKEETKHKEKLMATGSDGLLEVYVSAVNDPDKFWVQMMGPCTVELDRLNEKMTDYYSKEENRQLHILKEVEVDQIVAAPFFNDNKWYRAEISSIKVDEYDPEESELSLYYVDYGDSAECKKKDVYELRTDFLRLRFQAIECILAKVKPREAWSEDAVDLFEDLTHTGLWKSMTARIHGYRERPTRAKRDGSPVPCVELYDSHGMDTINVGEELIKKGFAVPDVESKDFLKKSQKDNLSGNVATAKQNTTNGHQFNGTD